MVRSFWLVIQLRQEQPRDIRPHSAHATKDRTCPASPQNTLHQKVPQESYRQEEEDGQDIPA